MSLGENLKRRKDWIIKSSLTTLDEEVKVFLNKEQMALVRDTFLDAVNTLFREMSIAIAATADVYIQRLDKLETQVLPANFDSETYPLDKLEEQIDSSKRGYNGCGSKTKDPNTEG